MAHGTRFKGRKPGRRARRFARVMNPKERIDQMGQGGIVTMSDGSGTGIGGNAAAMGSGTGIGGFGGGGTQPSGQTSGGGGGSQPI